MEWLGRRFARDADTGSTSREGSRAGDGGLGADAARPLELALAVGSFARPLAEVLEATSDFVGLAHPDGRVLYVNVAGRRMVGLAPEADVTAMTVADFVAPDVLERFTADALGSLERDGAWRGQTRLRTADGSGLLTSQVILAHRSEAGELEMLSTIARDISGEQRAQGIVALNATILERVASSEPLSLVLDDLTRAIEGLAPGALASVLLLDEDGEHLRHGGAPSLPDAYNEAIDGIEIGPRVGSCGTAAFRGEAVVVEDVATDPLWEDFRELAAEHGLRSCWSTPIHSGGGDLLGTFAVYHPNAWAPDDADRELIAAATHLARTAIEHDRVQLRLRRSEQRALRASEEAETLAADLRHHNDRLQHLAHQDPLTGLANRRRLEDELDRHCDDARRYGAQGALLLLDLDHFKYVNDALGHAGGDELLLSVAALLRERLRSTDMLARLGGDEFAVLLGHADPDQALRVADDLRGAVAAHVVTIGGQPRQTTTSIGVAPVDARDGVSGADLLVRADLAMYDAKEAGRDRVVALSTAQLAAAPTQARVTWVERMRDALAHDRFALHAQPVRPVGADRDGEHYELLLRMRSDDGGLVQPDAFLPIAERLDLVREIDRWVVAAAMRLLHERQGDGTGPAFEVNLSARSIGDPALLDLVDSGLREHGVDPSRLVFEITETGVVQNFERARAFAERLGELGCRIALDDFGAGFGAFYYLKHLPFDFLKIDGEFVRRSQHSRIDPLVIDAVVNIAHALGKQTIAECIEDAETAALVRAHGVDYLQGFWIGRPQPVELLLG